MKVFIIRLLFLYPLSIALWWLVGPWQVESVATLSSSMIRWVFPLTHLTTEASLEGVVFHLQGVTGVETLFKMDPLAVTRGLPLYLALMTAVSGIRVPWIKVAIGMLLLSALATVGFVAEALLHAQKGLLEVGFSDWSVPGVGSLHGTVPANFIQLLTKLLVTRALPIGLFLWQTREVIKALILSQGQKSP